MPTRLEIARAAAARLERANPASIRAFVGFDGFVDSIIEVVDKRHSATSYDRLKTIAEFGRKILAAAGQSSNYEFIVTRQKLGGNGPIMSNALVAAGFPLTYVGNLGYPAVHAVFADLASRAEVYSIAEPGYTDAVEFVDGKLMLGKNQALADVNWENIETRVGRAKLRTLLDRADFIGLGNWTMLPHMTAIWRHLLEVLPTLSAKPRRAFIDLADPEKRTRADLADALAELGRFQGSLNVTLGLNLKESEQVAAALNLPAPGAANAGLERTAAAIRNALKIGTVVIHPRHGAAGADASGTAYFAGPFVKVPKISTGAGDHFNAGFAAGQLLGLDLAEALAAGCATSGYYVRHAASPTLAELSAFLKDLPPGQE
jgi:sugar/nucleoside kinase (ribokinase family)